MKNTILDRIKLESLNNHILNKFTRHVKDNNRPDNLRNIINLLNLSIMIETGFLKYLG